MTPRSGGHAAGAAAGLAIDRYTGDRSTGTSTIRNVIPYTSSGGTPMPETARNEHLENRGCDPEPSPVGRREEAGEDREPGEVRAEVPKVPVVLVHAG